MIKGRKVRLRSKRLDDAWKDYNCQTDIELTRLDAVSPLTATFNEYLSDYITVLRSSSSTRHQFAVETMKGEHIGNCTYYDVDETKGEAQLGIMIGARDYWDKGYGADAVSTLVDYIFCQTNLNRIHLKTLDWNIRAQTCFKKCGFTPCRCMVKDGFSFEIMELSREQWEKWRTSTLT